MRPDLGGDEGDYVVELIQEANRRVYTRASEDAEAAGMGTTMTVALVGLWTGSTSPSVTSATRAPTGSGKSSSTS